MKVTRKTVFAVAYIIVAFVAYALFFNYHFSKYKEEQAILEAEWAARYPSLKGFEPDNFFFSSVWGRNVVNVGFALLFGGMIGAFILMTISDMLDKRRKQTAA